MGKMKGLRRGLLLFAWLVLAVALCFAYLNERKFRARAENAAGVDMNYFYDFTKETPNSLTGEWTEQVFDHSGLRISGEYGGIVSLTPCVNDPATLGVGQVTYKVNAPEGQLFDSFKVITFGRITHWNGEMPTGNSKLVISVGETPETLEEFLVAPADNAAGICTKTYDLSEALSGLESAYIRFDMSGYGDSWVNFESITFEGVGRYVGYENVTFTPEYEGGAPAIAIGEETTLQSVVAMRGEELFESEARVFDPRGNEVELDAESGVFVPNDGGRYEVIHTVTDETRTYSYSYYLYAVENPEESGLTFKETDTATGDEVWNKAALKNTANYYSANGGVSGSSDGVMITGEGNYLLPLDFSSRLSLVFNLAEFKSGSTVDIAFTGAPGEVNFNTLNKAGLYFTLSHNYKTNEIGEIVGERVLIRGYFTDGSSIASLGEGTRDGVSGVHGLGLGRRSSSYTDGIFVYYDGVEYGGGPTAMSVFLSKFMERDTVYVSYRAKEADFEVLNLCESDAKFPLWKILDEGVMTADCWNLLTADSSHKVKTEYAVLSGVAAYAPQIDATDSVTLTFDIHSLTAEPLTDGAKIEFVYAPTPVTEDFAEKTSVGLYFTLELQGERLKLTAFWQDGTELKELGDRSLGKKSDKKTSFELTLERKRDKQKAYTGEILFDIDGDELATADVGAIDSELLFEEENTLYFALRAEKASAEIFAVGKPAEFTTKGLVGDIYRLPKVKMVDTVDGEVNYTVKVTDPNGLEVELFDDGGRDAFNLVYEGRYTVTYSAKDYAGNAVDTVKRVNAELKDGAPVLSVTAPEEYGRAGVAVKIKTPKVKVDGETVELAVKITVTHPNGGSLLLKGDSFTPFDIGLYTLVYEAENEVATTREYYEIQVKANVDPEDSYEDILKAEAWTQNTQGAEETKEGLFMYENGYSLLPFNMEEGVEVTVDLKTLKDKNREVDCWVSIGFGCAPVMGGFGEPQPGFVYFMMYKDGQNYSMNANYCDQTGYSTGLFSEDLGTSGEAIISIRKLTGSQTYTDNIDIYINHKKIEYGTEKNVTYSQIVDNEEFIYLSFFAYGVDGKNPSSSFKGATIKEVFVCDQKAPEAEYSFAVPTEARLGKKVELPTIELSDNLDENFRSTVRLYAPNGKTIDIESGSFKASQKGSYYLVVKAYDKSGNDFMEIHEIVVKGESGGCGSALQGGVSLLLLLFGVGMVALRTKKNVKREGN